MKFFAFSLFHRKVDSLRSSRQAYTKTRRTCERTQWISRNSPREFWHSSGQFRTLEFLPRIERQLLTKSLPIPMIRARKSKKKGDRQLTTVILYPKYCRNSAFQETRNLIEFFCLAERSQSALAAYCRGVRSETVFTAISNRPDEKSREERARKGWMQSKSEERTMKNQQLILRFG